MANIRALFRAGSKASFRTMNKVFSFLFLVAAAPVWSHPHVFVETTLHFRQNAEGQIVEVEVTWAYDDFFSLLILEDEGLDKDGDGELTDAEYQQLWAFDLKNWYDGFEGALFLTQADGSKIALGAPRATMIDIDAGRIVAGHRRSIPPTSPADITIEQYDPTFYVAYSVSGGVTFDRGCAANVVEADLNAATAARDQALLDSLAAPGTDIFEFVELGTHYADRIKVTCNDLS